MLLNFSDQTRTGVFNMVWPYTSEIAVTTFSHVNKNPPNHANCGQSNKNNLLRAGFEPATYGFLFCFQLQSTALPTELSKVHDCQTW